MFSVQCLTQVRFLFAHFTKKQYLCTRNESTPWDYVFKGGQLQDIIKASIALCAWHFGIW